MLHASCNTSDISFIIYLSVFKVFFSLFCSSVTIHFNLPDGQRKTAKAKVGDNLLDTVLQNQLDIDGYGWLPWFLHSMISGCLILDRPQQ